MSSTFADELQVRLFVRAMNAHAAPSARPNAFPNASAAPGAVVCPPPVLHASSPHRDRRAHDLHVPWNELVNEKNGVVIGVVYIYHIFTLFGTCLVLVFHTYQRISIPKLFYVCIYVWHGLFTSIYLYIFAQFWGCTCGVHVDKYAIHWAFGVGCNHRPSKRKKSWQWYTFHGGNLKGLGGLRLGERWDETNWRDMSSEGCGSQQEGRIYPPVFQTKEI